MKLRLWKIGLLAGPLLLLAGLTVLIAFAVAMKWQFWNTVNFKNDTAVIKTPDRQAIRRLILNEDTIKNPKNPLVRYRVDLTKREVKNNTVILTGTVEPNRDVAPYGYIGLKFEGDAWSIYSFVTTGD